jgi:hypothetical protein
MDRALGLAESVERVAKFSGRNLASTIADFEYRFENLGKSQLAQQMAAAQIDLALLKAAFVVKRAAAQIDVVLHSLGILVLLPLILSRTKRLSRCR